MDRQEVDSTVIGAVGHSRVLEIEFESGRIYQYYDVPEAIYEEMLKAESKGKYFNSHIRGKFKYQEIEFKHRES
ncbi:MAG: KTSC domain-containing protein [Chloroflexota bacterium]